MLSGIDWDSQSCHPCLTHVAGCYRREGRDNGDRKRKEKPDFAQTWTNDFAIIGYLNWGAEHPEYTPIE